MSTKIVRIAGRRVWDSRGRPTVEAEVELEGGATGRAIAPAGASMGTAEAVELRDRGSALGGFDVQAAVRNVSGAIARTLEGMDAADQSGVDRALENLDGTRQLGMLGGNAVIAVSLAVLQAAAAARGLPLWQHLADATPRLVPLPEVQIFGGGAHAGGRIDIQDLMVVCPSARSFAEAMDRTAEVYLRAGRMLADSGRLRGVADEGGWWPDFSGNEEAIEFLTRAIERAGYAPGSDVAISLDVAASEFGSNGRYRLALDGSELDRDGLGELLLGWVERYPIVSIEDPFAEDDAEGFRLFAAATRGRVQIVGDDLLVTDAERVGRAAEQGLVTAALIKPNQAGTVTRTLSALRRARDAGLATIVSARSGESEDVAIVHLAVGLNAGQIKVGALARGERTAKWNELLRIEERLGSRAHFAGGGALSLSVPDGIAAAQSAGTGPAVQSTCAS
jgi:enolase